jgi:hypothetical protein
MKENNLLPIVGNPKYGILGTVIEMGGSPTFCSPHMPMMKEVPGSLIFFCMQHDWISPLEIFRILMWILETAVFGGYLTNVEDAISFLKTNGITMRPGELDLVFELDKDEYDSYILNSCDDRSISIGRYDDLVTMVDSFYNVLSQMRSKFMTDFVVKLELRGEEAKKFASLLETYHSQEEFKLVII